MPDGVGVALAFRCFHLGYPIPGILAIGASLGSIWILVQGVRLRRSRTAPNGDPTMRGLSERPFARRVSLLGGAITLAFMCLLLASAMGVVRVPYLGAAYAPGDGGRIFGDLRDHELTPSTRETRDTPMTRTGA